MPKSPAPDLQYIEDDIAKLQAQVADHEARLTALEASEQPPVEQPPTEPPPIDEGETLQALVNRGGAVELPKETYKEFCTCSKPVQVTGMPSTIDVTGVVIGNGKAVFEANADLELHDLVLRGASVDSNNGCAVRGGVGVSMLIEHCEITGNEMGLLLAGGEGASLTISGCYIHENGLTSGGLGHEIYCNAMPCSQYGDCNLMVMDTNIVGGPRSCIALKSRATSTTVQRCELRGSTSTDGSVAGRVVDIPDGGEVLISDCEIELMSTSPTASILGYCTETTQQGVGTVTLRNVKIIDGRGRGGEFWARSGVGAKLVLEGCTYTANAAPTLTGWATVTGQFTKV